MLVCALTHFTATEVDLIQPANVQIIKVITHKLLSQLLHARQFVMTFLVRAVHTFMQQFMRPAHQGTQNINEGQELATPKKGENSTNGRVSLQQNPVTICPAR